MGTMVDETGHKSFGSGNGRGSFRRSPAGREIGTLIADVEELMTRLVDAADPEITRLRDQVQRTVTAVKESLAESVDSFQDRLQERASEAVGMADNHVRRKPWSTLAIVALAAMAIGL